MLYVFDTATGQCLEKSDVWPVPSIETYRGKYGPHVVVERFEVDPYSGVDKQFITKTADGLELSPGWQPTPAPITFSDRVQDLEIGLDLVAKKAGIADIKDQIKDQKKGK